VFLTSLHCTFMLHTQRGCLNSQQWMSTFLPSFYVVRFVLVQICLKIRCSVRAGTALVTERFIVLREQQVVITERAVLVPQTVYHEMVRRFMNAWQVCGSGLGLIKVLSRHWIRGSEKNGKILQTRRSEREGHDSQ
jgi:hypothetical protein